MNSLPETESESETSIPSQFSHSVKIEQTRVTVHVNTSNGLEAMEQAINLYRTTRMQLEQLKEVVAPMEVKA